MISKKRHPRIGIYSGAFDPVHAGHITFALQALQTAKLDRVYFMPERRPRYKQQVEHFAHRIAMLKRASRPHSKFGVLEMVDINFSVERTLPKLLKQFPKAQLVFLQGSDDAQRIPLWPHYEQLLDIAELIVGVRTPHDMNEIEQIIAAWPIRPKELTIFESYAPDVSSRAVREGLRARRQVRGLLQSVAHYSNRHWLYISLS